MAVNVCVLEFAYDRWLRSERQSAVAARYERSGNGDVRVAGIRRTGARRSIKC